MGVYAPQYVMPVANTLAELGVERALVIHGTDGIDEVSITAPTVVAEVNGTSVIERRIDARTLGLREAPHEALAAQSLDGAVALASALVEGRERGPALDLLLANAAAAIVAAGMVDDLVDGVGVARDALESGAARDVLERLRSASTST